MKTAIFMGRSWKYDSVEVTFATKEDVALHATKIIRSEKVTPLPTYKGRRSARLHIDRVTSDIKWERMEAAMLSTNKESLEIESVSKTNCVNRRGYGIGVWLSNILNVFSIRRSTRVKNHKTLL